MRSKNLLRQSLLSFSSKFKIVYKRKEFTLQNKENALNQPLKGTIDPFHSIHVSELDFFINNKNQFKSVLDVCLGQWKENNVKAVWLKINSKQLDLVEMAVKSGFDMHHCTMEYIILNQWLIDGETSRLPHYTSHYIGAGGLIINDKNEILLVQEKNGYQQGLWGIPGGLVDDGELITEAAEREVREETGLDAKAYDILMFTEVLDSRYNKADIYFVILLNLKDQDQQINLCQTELSNFIWVKLDQIEEFVKTHKCGPAQYETLKLLVKLQSQNVDFKKPVFDIWQGEKEFYGSKKRFSVYQPYL